MTDMTETAEFDVAAYIASKGYIGKRGSTGEHSYPCFFDCGEEPTSRKRKLYINERSGFFKCHVCETRGGTHVLLSHFGDIEEGGTSSTPVAPRHRVLAQAAEIGQSMLESNEDLMLYLLTERGLSPETIIDRRIGYVGGRWSLSGSISADEEALLSSGIVYPAGDRKGKDFFYNHLLIPYVEGGRVVQMRGKVLGGNAAGRYMTGAGDRVRLFNADDARCNDVIVTEGEFDAMKLKQELSLSSNDRARSMGVVGLPGAGAAPEDFVAQLKDAKRIYLALDPDDPGKSAMVKYKDLFGARARIVELPEDMPKKADWTYLLTEGGWGWREALGALGEAAGKRVYSIYDSYHAWKTSEAHQGNGLKTGFSEFDDVVTPGLLPGQLFILLAKTGTGKTIMLCNIAVNMAAAGTKILFISLEQTREEVYERLQRIFRFYMPLATDRELNEALDCIAIVDQNRLNEQDITDLIEEYEVELGYRPEAVFVDYLGYFARGAEGTTPYEKNSNAVMALKGAAKKERVVMITPHQVNRGVKEGAPIEVDDARDSGVIEETADFLASIFRPDEKTTRNPDEAPTGKLRLEILKSRHGGKGRVFGLQMDLLTLAIVGDRTDLARNAAHHTYLHWRGQSHADLRAEQTKPTQGEIAGLVSA